MTKDEALKLALKFVEDSECGTADLEAAIKEALAQRTWVGLTDEERDYFTYINAKDKARFRKYFDYIEAKLKEKNVGTL